jgi:4-hydroxy-2-oxoheptanedioate aldolase
MACGKAAGILTGTDEAARKYLDMGATFVAVGVDAVVFARSVDALADKFITRAATSAPAPGSAY